MKIHLMFDFFFEKFEFNSFDDHKNLKNLRNFFIEKFKFQDISINRIFFEEEILFELIVIFKSKDEYQTMKVIDCKEGIPNLKTKEIEIKEFKKLKNSEMKIESSSEIEENLNFMKTKKIEKIFENFGINLDNEILNESKFELEEYYCSKDLIILKNEFFEIKESIRNEIINKSLKEIKNRNFQYFLNEKEEKKEKVFDYFIPNVNQKISEN